MRGIAFIFLLFTWMIGNAAYSVDLKIYLYDSNGNPLNEQLDKKVKMHYGETVADLKKYIRRKLGYPIKYGEVYSKSLGKEIPFDDVINIAAFENVFRDSDEYRIHVEVEKVDKIDTDEQDYTPREPTYAELKNYIEQYYRELGYEIDTNYEEQDEKISMALFIFISIVAYLLFCCRKKKSPSSSVHSLTRRHAVLRFHFNKRS